ncbi:MAG: hypothetical protein WC452_08845 [Aminobacteriaceae bacterium]|uniref:hypothetical protein n=1 Tax=Aminivibrio sp. TaxID=1872489 RepID=UPI002A230B26|nr:hypothetical protein [Synergistaceae bacterium]MDD3390960.1 hypothetical protein [Synergistaceae bacterium]MDD4021106.1 hypothetical protein [Synergistaceae bacterium]MDD4613086.1 hypothetical protein [Synergistaceae bacterium]
MSETSENKSSSRWKKFAVFLALLAVGGYFAFEAVRDIALDLSEGRIPSAIPDTILENIKIDREIEGDLWKADIGKVERGKDWANFFDIDIEMTRKTGQLWTLKAPKGRYFEKNMRAEISDPDGTMTEKGIVFYYSAPLAKWEQKTNIILFPDGVVASGDMGRFSGSYVKLLPGGVMEAEKGASLVWFDPEGKKE